MEFIFRLLENRRSCLDCGRKQPSGPLPDGSRHQPPLRRRRDRTLRRTENDVRCARPPRYETCAGLQSATFGAGRMLLMQQYNIYSIEIRLV